MTGMDGMGWGMGVIGVLVIAVLVLGIARFMGLEEFTGF